MITKKLTPKTYPELAGKVIEIRKDYNGKKLYILDSGVRCLRKELEEGGRINSALGI